MTDLLANPSDLAVPGALALCVALILVTGRVPYLFGFRLSFADRRVDPLVYWWFVIGWIIVALGTAWPLLRATPLGALPGVEAVAENAALVYGAGGPVLLIVALIGGAFAERRRAYMRKTYPSALHRASGEG